MTGELAPGTRLAEHGLAKSLHVSRGPLREAMQRLEGRKLVTRVPHVGASVVSLSSEDLLDVMTTRAALEGAAARQAAERMSDEEIERLREVIKNFDRRSQTDAVHLDVPAEDFHYGIAQGTKNKYLIDLLCNDLYYLLKLSRYRSGVRPGRRRTSADEHLAILDAIAERDPDRAERMMHEHLRHAREGAVESLAREAQASAGPKAEALLS